jgi:hypothetical protein
MCALWSFSLFKGITHGREVVLRNTAPILLRLNDPQNDPIELYSYEGINTAGIPVSDLFITTMSGGSDIRVWLLGWN